MSSIEQPTPPASGTSAPAQEMTNALRDANRAYHNKQQGDKRRKRGRDWDTVKGYIRQVGILALIVLGIAIIDGARREYQEFFAMLSRFHTSADVRRGTENEKVPTALNMRLQSGDTLSTDTTGTATLVFPDGGAVEVDPSTTFAVQSLDFTRKPRRDRSFLLSGGSIFTRISKLFGANGQTIICSPNAVAAARGTGFSVAFAPDAKTTIVSVVDGKVSLRNAGGRVVVPKNYRGIARGNDAPYIEPLSGSVAAPLAARFARLARLEPKPNRFVDFEHGVLRAIDPLISRVGLTPGGFDPTKTDGARRAATTQGLRRLQQSLAAQNNGDAPDELNPVTLDEAGVSPADRKRILSALAGFTIDSYQKRGANGYLLRCRSTDTNETVYELTETGIRLVAAP